MANAASANSIAELQSADTFAGAVVFLTEPGREGAFIWRSGNFAARIAADPGKGLYVPSFATMPSIGCWVRDWDETHGKPEWFGAVVDDPTSDNRAALAACFALCPVTVLGAHDYYIRDTLVLDRSNRGFIGAPCAPLNRDTGVGLPSPMGNRGGSRVILAGQAVVEAPVFQFGKRQPPSSDNDHMTRNCILRDINFCRDNTQGSRVRAASAADASACVKGIVCSGLAASLISNVSSFDSPVGWFVTGCAYCKWDDCAAWRSTPAASAANDFSVGFLVGGYKRNYGYAGANASVYFNRCASYDLHGGSISLGFRLFGAVADTFLTQVEVGRCNVGIEIDGRDASGKTIGVGENDLQQDIHLISPLIDAVSDQGLQLRNLNASFNVAITSPYIATARAKADLHIMGGADRVEGQISIVGGIFLGGGNAGLVATDGIGITVQGTMFRNYGAPISLTNCRNCRIEPDLNNISVMAPNGVYAKGLRRSSIKPIIRSGSGAPGFANGIFLEGGDHNAIDPTMVDYEAFSNPSPARKVIYSGRDARGDAAFKEAGNVLLGVLD